MTNYVPPTEGVTTPPQDEHSNERAHAVEVYGGAHGWVHRCTVCGYRGPDAPPLPCLGPKTEFAQIVAALRDARTAHAIEVIQGGVGQCLECGEVLRVEFGDDGQPLFNPFIEHHLQAQARAVLAVVTPSEPCVAPPGNLCTDTGCWDMDRCVIFPPEAARPESDLRMRDQSTVIGPDSEVKHAGPARLAQSEHDDDLPARVRDLRKRRGLSLREAADQIGMSFNTLTRIEQGKNYETRHRETILRWLATDDGSCVTRGRQR